MLRWAIQTRSPSWVQGRDAPRARRRFRPRERGCGWRTRGWCPGLEDGAQDLLALHLVLAVDNAAGNEVEVLVDVAGANKKAGLSNGDGSPGAVPVDSQAQAHGLLAREVLKQVHRSVEDEHRLARDEK